MKNYRIVISTDPGGFATEVEKWLDLGWICQGGVTTSVMANGLVHYAQALVQELVEE